MKTKVFLLNALIKFYFNHNWWLQTWTKEHPWSSHFEESTLLWCILEHSHRILRFQPTAGFNSFTCLSFITPKLTWAEQPADFTCFQYKLTIGYQSWLYLVQISFAGSHLPIYQLLIHKLIPQCLVAHTPFFSAWFQMKISIYPSHAGVSIKFEVGSWFEQTNSTISTRDVKEPFFNYFNLGKKSSRLLCCEKAD